MQHRQDVVEQVFHSQPQAVQVGFGGGRQVGAALLAVPFQSETLVAEPRGEESR